MKNQFFKSLGILLLSCAILFGSCAKEDIDNNKDKNAGSSANGNWKRGDGVETYLKFDGTTAITCINGTATYGTFNSSIPSMTFVVNGNKMVFPLQFNSDNSMLMGVPDQAINTNNATLYYRSNNFPCGGNGGGGSTSEGDAMFWMQSDFNCGNITVTLNGESATISQYFSNGTPSCGVSGCANFSLSPGVYAFSANCSSKKWSGTITVKAGGCSKMQLTE